MNMLRALTVGVGVAVVLGGCGSGGDAGGVSFAGPGDMLAKARGGGVSLSGCEPEQRDVTGGLSIQCQSGDTDMVSFSTFNNADAAASSVEYLQQMNWVVTQDGSWVVAATSQALHDELVAALK